MASRYQATQQGGPLEVVPADKPSPTADEVLIKVKAVGLNPIDAKRLYYGILVPSWPVVLGGDGAGVVEDVGSNVKTLKKGDEVLATFASGDPRGAAFQDYAALPQSAVGLKPKSFSDEEAASLPIAFITAAAAVYHALQIPLPFLPEGRPDGYKPKSVLVVGGSSNVGAAAIQLLRIALPDATILTTSSPKHHALARSHGATAVFDYKSSNLVEQIKKASPNGEGVEAIIDAVNGVQIDPSVFQVLTGLKYLAEVATGQNLKDIPAGVKHSLVFGRSLFDAPGGSSALAVLGKLVDEGKYKLPAPITVVGKGFEAIGKGLETLKDGVSGTKLVVTL